MNYEFNLHPKYSLPGHEPSKDANPVRFSLPIKFRNALSHNMDPINYEVDFSFRLQKAGVHPLGVRLRGNMQSIAAPENTLTIHRLGAKHTTTSLSALIVKSNQFQ